MTNKDQVLIEFIYEGTKRGTVRWEPTASDHEFLATLRGSHTIVITRNDEAPDVLTLRNAIGQEILVLDGSADNRINQLYRLAQRNAFNVDKTIDEIIGAAGPITDSDIPF